VCCGSAIGCVVSASGAVDQRGAAKGHTSLSFIRIMMHFTHMGSSIRMCDDDTCVCLLLCDVCHVVCCVVE